MEKQKITLQYFNLNARGSTIRALLNYGKIPFTNTQYSFEEWGKLDKTPFEYGQMPILEVDGLRMSQSVPIAIYVARRLNLMGSTPEEEAAILSVVCSFDDWTKIARPVIFPLNDEEKAKLADNTKTFLDGIVKFLVAYEKRLVKNGGKYMTGNFSLADVALTCTFKQLFWFGEDRVKNWVPVIEKNAPTLLKLIENVSTNELKCFFDGGAFLPKAFI